ncbi:MAG: hypothetical protein AMXMBFR4_02350 [Candidatus Hydrogenedentota bacterium]
MIGDESRRMRIRAVAVLAMLDALAFVGMPVAALALRFRGDIPVEHAISYVFFLPALLGWRFVCAITCDLYDFRRRLSPSDFLLNGCGAAMLAVGGGYLLMAIVQLYYVPWLRLSRLTAAFDMAGLALWFCLTRGAAMALLRRAGYKVRLLVIGPKDECAELAGELRRHGPPILNVHVLSEVNGAEGHARETERALRDRGIDAVLLAETGLPQGEVSELLSACERIPADVYLLPGLDLSILASSRVVSIAGLPLVPLQPPILTGVYAPVKRLMDVVAAAALMFALSPVAVIAAIAIWLESGRPALYSQERVGQARRPIRVKKFRTMIADAEAESGPVLSAAHDPRVTRVGRVLRTYRIDEVPQLWNVLKGEMSLVGPRPERPEFVERFVRENPLYERRFLVKPGLTGLAQIHGRYDSDYAHKLRYDLIYINSMSFVTDVRIMIATLRTVLTGHGAVA